MSSPFSFFRRNQHVTMVGVVILSMIAFTIGDMFSGQGQHYVLLGLMMGGIIFGFAGVGRGRWVQYGIAGAVLGAVCGWVLPAWISPANPFVRTSTLGAFDEKRISDLMLRRSISNVFMQQAFEKTIGPGMGRFAPQFEFYPGNVEDDLTFGELMRAEADELNIVVTDSMVSDYINKRTQDKLTAANFAEIRTNLNLRGTVVTEEELFDSFRGEIKAVMAYQHLNPHFASIPQGPEVFYELFKRTKVSQRLNTVRLDVDAFVSEVAEPSDAEVAQLFAENRLKFPAMDEPGSPGFRQPPKTKLAFLELGYKAVEKNIAAPTDAEVEAYYNENKDRMYRKPVETKPETGETPTGEPTEGASTPQAPEGSAPPEEPKPEEPKPEEPKPEEPKPEEPKPEEPKPEEPKPEEPKPEEPKPEEPKAEAPSDQCLPFADEEKPATEAPATEAPAAPAVETPATEAPKEEPPAAESKLEPAAEEAAASAAPAVGSVNDSTKPEFEIPKIEYQPLDDDLKGEIRDRLLDEKVRATLQEKMASVMLDLKALEKDRAKARKAIVDADRSISDEALYEKMRDYAKTMNEGMKAIGEKHGCTFVEIPLVTFQDLNEGETYPIGAATDPSANPFMQAGSNVAQQVFGSFPNRISDDTNLFVRKQSVKNAFDLDGGEVHFAWWIVEFSATHVPKLEDPGIRDQVVLAWKRTKARELAKKRAEELAKVVRDGLALPESERKDMATSVEGQTVLGKPESAALAVRQTQPFSWMEQAVTPQMNFMQQRPTLRRSEVRFNDEAGGSIRYAGDRFMRTALEEIASEAVGVVATDDLMSFYVVQPVERSADDEILRQQFLTEGKQSGFADGPVAQMLNTEVSNAASIAWERGIWAKYGVDRDTLPEE